MKELKGFISGVIATALVLTFIVPAYAAYQKQATLNYNDIKIKVDGEMMTPTDATGAVVEPFIIDGTTYLPVRAIANALDLSVNWDGETKTINLMSEDQPTEENQLTEVENMEITLSTPFWEGNEVIQVERTGTYTGTVLNNFPEGKGKFETENDYGNPWYYEGDFKNGLFNGQGLYCSTNFDYKEIGTHVDGLFTPTKSEFFETICYNSQAKCIFQSESIAMIDDYQNIFPCKNAEDMTTATSLIDSALTYSMIYKNPSAHLQNLHQVEYATALQVFEYEYFGHTNTKIIAYNENGDYYIIHYDGSIEVYDNDRISFTALPVGTSSYDNIGGGVTNVIVTIGSIVEPI